MYEKKLQGRMTAMKVESIQLLKQEGVFLEFCEERGFVYELTKEVYGKLTKIILSIKSGKILVHQMIKKN